MTAEEIRKAINHNKGTWQGVPFYVGSHGATSFVLVEIAAQLAELNENLRKLKGKE